MTDEVLIDIPYILRASKRIEHQENVILRYTTLIKFLQKHNLVKDVIIKDSQQCSNDFLLMESHLTARGLDFFDDVIDSWEDKLDKGANPSDDGYLEKKFNKK